MYNECMLFNRSLNSDKRVPEYTQPINITVWYLAIYSYYVFWGIPVVWKVLLFLRKNIKTTNFNLKRAFCPKKKKKGKKFKKKRLNLKCTHV